MTYSQIQLTYPHIQLAEQLRQLTYPHIRLAEAFGKLISRKRAVAEWTLRFIRQQLLNKLSPQLFQTAALPRVGSLLMNRARNPRFQSQLFPLPLDMIDIDLHGLVRAGLNRQFAQSQGFGGFR
jgi:hypothetical protein